MRLDNPRVPIPQEIVASCTCGVGLIYGWLGYKCPECGIYAMVDPELV